ncbi:hypothetical protein SK128_008127 [Halocaridina rubra]|uniref:MD-2-related lipid-recognition domain-containing protein n=1 Tax=Halocaridina rubra TaxID=373956 RepID=A0AAN9A0Z4_HALRR
MKLLLVFGFFWAAYSVLATPFQDCGSLASKTSFLVGKCPTPPCILLKGQSYNVTMNFTSSVDTKTLTINVTAHVAGSDVPWPGLDHDGCKELAATSHPCPISAGTDVNWMLTANVSPIYPSISTTVTFKLTDDSGGSQMCARIPVIVH